MTQTRFDATNNFRSGALLVEQDGARNGHVIVDPSLCLVGLHLVVKKRIFFAIFSSGRAANNNDRRFFCIGACDGVQNIQTSDTVSDADEADSVDARIPIGRRIRRQARASSSRF
jgi:hypothetical protein